jgi:hypothetical protein
MFRGLSLRNVSRIGTYGNKLNKQIIQTSIITPPSRYFMNSIRNKLNGNTNKSDNKNIYSELQMLVRFSPLKAIQAIEKGWNQKTLPVNDDIIRLYLQAAGNLKLFEKMDVGGFLRTISAYLENNGENMAVPSSNAFMSSSNGTSPTNPLYFQQVAQGLDMGGVFKSGITISLPHFIFLSHFILFVLISCEVCSWCLFVSLVHYGCYGRQGRRCIDQLQAWWRHSYTYGREE